MLESLLLSFALVGRPQVQLPQRPATFEVRGVNLTQEFSHFFADEEDLDVKLFQNSSFIFVPGFLSDQFLTLGELPYLGDQILPPFSEQMEFLESKKVHCQLIRTFSEQTPDQNVPLLKEALIASPQPVIFVSHSRGGLDVLTTLLSLDPSLRSKVRGWIALQAPFQGSPLADSVLQSPRIRHLASRALRSLGGSIEAVVEMSVAYRQKFMHQQVLELNDIVRSIPIVSFSTWKRNIIGKIDTHYELQRDFLDRQGYQTDGLVPWQSAILPGSKYVYYEGLDHTTTVHKRGFINFDRVKMFKALLQLL